MMGNSALLFSIVWPPPKNRAAREKRQSEVWITPERRKDLVPFDAKSLIHMVRLAGIEPTTPWFVAKYSIQLSYSRPIAILARGMHSIPRALASAKQRQPDCQGPVRQSVTTPETDQRRASK